MTTELRPRNPWEAMDLGAVMLRAWWQPVYGAAACIVVPAALLAHLLFDSRFLALVAVWWLKPLYDRVVLHVLANALFGARPRLGATIARLPSLVRSTGIVAALGIRRLDPARSFNLPVRQLEGQSGLAARSRERLLGRRMAAQTSTLLYACLAFEVVVAASLAASVNLLVPAGLGTGPAAASLFPFAGLEDRGWMVSVLVVAAILAIEPLYVASGFALYLNRRTTLEAWDLEVRFRRLQSVAHPARARAAVLLAGIVLGCGAALTPDAARAAQRSSREIIREVLQAPEFEQYRMRKVWRLRKHDATEARSTAFDPHGWLASLGGAAALLLRLAVYAALAAGLLLAGRHLVRLLLVSADRRGRHGPQAPPPEVVFGLDVRPQSLPADLARLAAAAAKADPRLALSLLYRGALVSLIHRDRLAIAHGDTEAECVRRVRESRSGEVAGYFARLVSAWSQTAYGHRPPPAADIEALCGEWPRHFASGAPA